MKNNARKNFGAWLILNSVLSKIIKGFKCGWALFCKLIALQFLPTWLRCLAHTTAFFIAIIYLSLYAIIGVHAYDTLANPPTQSADAALILGNRAYLNGVPNPILTARVDEGIHLAQLGLVHTLVMSGGVDDEDGRVESVTMQTHARGVGFKGAILLESRSSSTLENLKFSLPILQKAGFKKLIIVSEPYHLWRVEQLVKAGHLTGLNGQTFEISYAAATNPVWQKWGMLFRGAMREPLAVIDNYAKGYFNPTQ